MIKQNILIICFFFVGFVIGGAVFGYLIPRQNLVDARELAVFFVDLQAIEEETGEPLNVAVRYPSPRIKGYLQFNGGEKSPPLFVEGDTSGRIRALWVDFYDHYAPMELSAEGYEPLQIDDELIRRFHTSGGGGIREPDTVELARAEPGEGGNGEHHGAGERSQ